MKKTNYKKNSVVTKLLEERGVFFELILIAFLLTFGTSIIANYLYNIPSVNMKILLTTGIALCIIPLGIILYKKFKNLQYNVNFDGFFVHSKKNNRLVSIPKYDFGDDLFNILESVFCENRALLAAWEKEPLHENMPSEMKCCNSAGKLLVEAIEHYLLDKLSRHLSGYFREGDDKKLYEYGRNDVPDLLLNNRIIDLISRPIEEREKFLDEEKKKNMYKIICKKDDGTEIIESLFCDGAKFDRFNLILPRNSKVYRVKEGTFKIETPKLSILFEVDFKGFTSSIPRLFITRYLKQRDHVANGIRGYCVHINLKIKFKFLSLLTWNGWEYHEWVDSFLTTLDEDINKESFFAKIDWERIEALLLTLAVPKEDKEKTAQDSKEEVAATLQRRS